MTEEILQGPRMTPAVEETDIPATACPRSLYDLIETISKHAKWTLRGSRVTISDKWGPVLRVDYVMPGEKESPIVTRMVCWQPPERGPRVLMECGYDVPPLPGEYPPR